MLILSTNWSNAFIVTGLGIMIVFIVLTLLVFLLTLSGKFFSRKNKKAEVSVLKAEIHEGDTFSEDEKAAIAMALYLYYEVHDEESYVITINEPDEHSSWNSPIHGAHEY